MIIVFIVKKIIIRRLNIIEIIGLRKQFTFIEKYYYKKKIDYASKRILEK